MVTTRSKSLQLNSESSKSEANNSAMKEIKTPRTPKRRKASSSNGHITEYIIFVSLLLDLLAFTMILPLFPSILNYYKNNDGEDGAYGYIERKINNFRELVGAPNELNTVLFGGFLGSLFSFLQFVSSPIAGAFSDVYGRKPVILLCLVGIASSYWLWSISSSFKIFVFARIIGGISKGNLSLSMAAVTDVSTSKGRTFGMALIGAAFSIGFVIGPMIGAYFTKTILQRNMWFTTPALFAFSLIIADIVFVTFVFKETLPKEKRLKSVASSVRQAFAYINVNDLFKFNAVNNLSREDMRQLRLLGAVYFLYLFLYSGLEFTLTFLTHLKFKFSSMEQGWMFAMMGITMVIIQGIWVRRIPADAVQKFATLGLLLIVPAFICVGIAETIFVLYVGVFLFAVSTSFVVPCMTTMASKYGSFDQKGTALGIFRSLGALARSVGPIVASSAYWMVGPTLTYCVGGVLLSVPWYLLKTSSKLKF